MFGSGLKALELFLHSCVFDLFWCSCSQWFKFNVQIVKVAGLSIGKNCWITLSATTPQCPPMRMQT
eukprot:1688164-Amphidinium_carterae.1